MKYTAFCNTNEHVKAILVRNSSDWNSGGLWLSLIKLLLQHGTAGHRMASLQSPSLLWIHSESPLAARHTTCGRVSLLNPLVVAGCDLRCLVSFWLIQDGKHYIPINTALLGKVGDPSTTALSEETPSRPTSHRDSGSTWWEHGSSFTGWFTQQTPETQVNLRRRYFI